MGGNPIKFKDWHISSAFMPRELNNGEYHKGIDIAPMNPKYDPKPSPVGGTMAIPSIRGDVEKFYSPCDGKVTRLSLDNVYGGGFTMYIDLFEKIDGKNVQLVFMHLNPGTKTNPKAGLAGTSFQFDVGDIVHAGDYIADMGATGTRVVGATTETRSTGVHLHFQVNIFESMDYNYQNPLNFGVWVPVNPLLYFNLRNYDLKME